jgi:signal peptidase II
MSAKSLRFWPLLLTVLVADCASKRVAEARLEPGTPRPVAGDVVRFTLGYNRDAAFSIPVGGGGRWVLVGLSGCALLALAIGYRRTAPQHSLMISGLALVTGGALGNLLDRVLSTRGVVDFIDVGIGATRFWTFNVADLGISVGAVLLAATLWRRTSGESAGGTS